jgi:hypothetical protein
VGFSFSVWLLLFNIMFVSCIHVFACSYDCCLWCFVMWIYNSLLILIAIDFWLSYTVLPWSILYMILVNSCMPFCWAHYQEGNCLVIMYVHIQNSQFLKMAVSIYTPKAMCDSDSCFKSLSRLMMPVLNFSHSCGYVVVLYCGTNLILHDD